MLFVYSPPDHPLALERLPRVVYGGDQVELGVHGVQDPEVEVVTEVGPDTDKHGKERRRRRLADVVDALGEL